MVKKRRRRDERNPVRIINDEWVENNCGNVTERDKNMLRLLERFPLMNSEHLMQLTSGGGGQKPFYELSQGKKRCNERIRILYDLHCINKWSPRLPIGEGTSKQYVALDRAGCKLLNIERRVRSEIPQDWKHQSLILDTYTRLVVGERESAWELEYLETEERQKTYPIIPDLTVVLRNKRKGAAFFIEVDRSEKKESVEKEKLKRYREWQLSRTWGTEKWRRKLPRPIFPTVLYAFDEGKSEWKRRATVLRKEANALGLQAEFMGIKEVYYFLKSILPSIELKP
jgi:hypothetical protein